MPNNFLEISDYDCTLRFLPGENMVSTRQEYAPEEPVEEPLDRADLSPVDQFPLIDDLPHAVRFNAYTLHLSIESCQNQGIISQVRDNLSAIDWYTEDTDLINLYLEYLINLLNERQEESFGTEITENSALQYSLDSINEPDRRSALVAPVGLEISYKAPKNMVDVYIKKLRRLLQNTGLMDGYGSRIYKDAGNVLEVCSPVIKTKSGISDWFYKVHAVAKSIGLVYMPKKVTSGGMHINMSFNKSAHNWRLAYVNLLTIFANHPEINWVFNDPGDLDSAKCMALNSRYQKAYHKLFKNDMILSDEIWEDFSVCGGKESAINIKDGHHFEVRTFQMPRSEKEMIDMLDFLNSLVEFCIWSASCDLVVPLEIGVPDMVCERAEDRGYFMNGDEHKRCYLSKMWSGEEDFKFLLKTIGLDPARYRKYVRRNYQVRRASPYGKTYMV